MSSDKSHVKMGLIFIAVSCVIGTALFLITVLGSSSSSQKNGGSYALTNGCGGKWSVDGNDKLGFYEILANSKARVQVSELIAGEKIEFEETWTANAQPNGITFTAQQGGEFHMTECNQLKGTAKLLTPLEQDYNIIRTSEFQEGTSGIPSGQQQTEPAATCSMDEVQLELPKEITGGTIEILTPIMDTGAREQNAYLLTEPMCLPTRDLHKMSEIAGSGQYARFDELKLDVTWDPLGTTDSFRSRFDYDSATFDMDEVRPAPSNMKFGTALWNLKDAVISVNWIDDFRQYQRDNFTSFEAAAPATASNDADRGNPVYSSTYNRCMDSGDAAQGITSAMMNCVGNELTVQDRMLNDVYNSIRSGLIDTQQIELRDKQRQWITFRDTNCTQRSEPERGGSLGELTYSMCILELTTKRKYELESF